MTPVVFGAVCAVVIAFVAGVLFGTATERNAWTLRADKGIAHNADGRFYLIWTERYFCDNYRLKDRLTHEVPQGPKANSTAPDPRNAPPE